MTRTICNQGTRIENVVAAPSEIFPNMKFASPDSTAIDNSRLVTGMVTANGNRAGMGQKLRMQREDTAGPYAYGSYDLVWSRCRPEETYSEAAAIRSPQGT